jgi:CheY-like chemotaxis protein
MRSNATVLLVEGDDEGRDVMAAWLEASGFDVITCSGPQRPGYVCVGERTGRCPVAEAADVVVLDGRLECADVPDGTSPYDLLVLYRTLGRPVVLVGGDDDARVLLGDEEDLLFVDGPGGEAGGGEGLVGSVRRFVR